jgi:hypothetical protein
MKKLIEMAHVVFKEIDGGDMYEVLKSRDGQLSLGGKYSRDLVEFYAKTNENVLVLDGGYLTFDDAEIEKWATIGRITNEFKDGDIVRVVKGRHPEGIIGEIGNSGLSEKPMVFYKGIGLPCECELITPVEARFDR